MTSGAADWRKAGGITAGVDVGTTSCQAAVMVDGELFSYANIRVGADFKAAARAAVDMAMAGTGMSLGDARGIVATGFGSGNVDFATSARDEILCHAKGARFMFGPSVKTVVDLGGQSTHAISLYDWDRVRRFQTSDKCATGMGRHMEVVAELLRTPITEMGALSLEADKDPEPVSTTCFNFAYPETVGLFRQGFKEEAYTENDVLAAYHFAIAWRILGTIGKIAPLDIGEVVLEKDVAFTGGLAKNRGITERLERELGITAASGSLDPQLAGAIGAALLA
jgi:predicted CoA-substrate-specific enzyme activase